MGSIERDPGRSLAALGRSLSLNATARIVSICKIIRTARIEIKDRNADVIVLGRHDRSGLVEFFTGSVCDRVIQHATCSVLIVKTMNFAKRDRR